MKRPIFWTFLAVATAVTALAAQDQQPRGEQGEKKAAAEQPKDVMAMLAKNLAAAEERLKKADPGDETRKIQREIIDLLDELIKQTNQQQNSGAGGKSKKSEQSKQGGTKGGKPDKSDGQKNPKDGNQDPQHGNDKAQAKPGKADQGQGQGKDKNRGEGKDDESKEGAAKTGGDNKGGKGEDKNAEDKDKGGQQASGGKAKQDPPLTAKNNLNPDMRREAWGHLPDKLRMEMDAYSKERFMPRYEDLLEQYYRSIAEQVNGKE
jgi:hypothetical protein